MESLFDAETPDTATEQAIDEEREAHDRPALSLGDREEPLVRGGCPPLREGGALEGRALALADVIAPRARPGEALMRLAYRLGVPGHALTTPFRRAEPMRLRATVDSLNVGDRARGVALRAGHFLVHGVRQPIGSVDFDCAARLSAGLERTVHSFSWLADLAASAPRADCIATAERIAKLWLTANPVPVKGPAWELELAALRLMAWLVHAPLVLSDQDAGLKSQMLAAIAQTADLVETRTGRSGPGFAQVAGWAAVSAAGLLLPQGKPRRLCAEAALVRALGELVAEDGGVLARCPAAQLDTIRLLTDLIACYDACEHDAPDALIVMRELLVPPLLAIRHGDGALGSWQGQGAIPARTVTATIDATGIRTRPLNEPQYWGFQRLRGAQTIVQFDAGPPPRARHARCGAASTLAFEMSDGDQRLIVNCGGAAMAGGLVPARIGQGLRASAAHSTLVLDNANSTAVLLHGKLGRGVETVEFERQQTSAEGGTRASAESTRIEASHDGYVARFGLTHTRILSLSAEGGELAGKDILVPATRRGKRGKVAFAIRFHLGRGIEAHLSEDEQGASLLAPDGTLWQFRMGGDIAADPDIVLACDDSLWVDGDGRPHATQQLVIEGLASRGGGQFSWLFKKMG